MTVIKKTTSKTAPEDVEKLIWEYQPRIRSFIRNNIVSREDADDILQDVFYQLIKTIDEAVNPIQHISAWLFKVARNSIINKRKKKKEQELPDFCDSESEIIPRFSEILFAPSDTSFSPEMEFLRSLVWSELENALSELPAGQREIFELTELDGIPVKDISETTGISVNTLLSRKHYAVLHLRNRLADLYHDIINT
ncbi:MAG: sigma-70 family RNA polymerase sigma factor [Bacteroidia bacterium]|nr:sigma-70 family RNA polymerase sigma factor [Bacteroidia bacterium]